jgi:hypothetical protein
MRGQQLVYAPAGLSPCTGSTKGTAVLPAPAAAAAAASCIRLSLTKVKDVQFIVNSLARNRGGSIRGQLGGFEPCERNKGDDHTSNQYYTYLKRIKKYMCYVVRGMASHSRSCRSVSPPARALCRSRTPSLPPMCTRHCKDGKAWFNHDLAGRSIHILLAIPC